MQLLMVAMSSGLGMPLTGTSMNDDLHACVPNQHTYFIHLLTAVVLNTFVVRLYYADGRTYTFQNFENTADGVNWSEVLPTGSQRSQTFSVAFPDRLVKTIRLRATNTSNPYLHLVRFQAFRVPPPVAVPNDDDAIPCVAIGASSAIKVASTLP